jgi:hypothetical protein
VYTLFVTTANQDVAFQRIQLQGEKLPAQNNPNIASEYNCIISLYIPEV